MPANAELQTAIDDAAAQIQADIDKVDGTPQTQNTETAEETDQETGETATEDQTTGGETETTTVDDLSPEQLEEARRLYRALSSYDTAGPLVAALAERTGLLKNLGQQTQTEVKETKKDILGILEEELGPTYKFLAPNLSKALTKVLAAEREVQQQVVSEIQINQTLESVNKTLDSLAKETQGTSRQLENRMAEIMKEYPIQSNGNTDKYIRDIYTLASAGRVKATVQKTVADKVRRNASNVADRVGRNGAANPGTDSIPAKKLGLKGSVEWALSQLDKGKK